MRRTATIALLFSLTALRAQTVLFTEDFEGAAPAFTLNTTDAGSNAAPDNLWLVNDAYAGGDGELECLGFPFTFTIPATSGQPAGITSANGNYLHIASQVGLDSGIECCSFVAPDGLCVNNGSHFARMSNDVGTVGAGEVTLSFWWLCGGSNNNYGQVYYSTDGGTAWTAITAPIAQYRDQQSWVQQQITLPAFSGAATLRFGFRFVNNTSLNAQDPGFGIDDVRITAEEAGAATISTGMVAPIIVCAGGLVQVPFTITGTFDAGNTFTAELSDATGDFAAPVAIGTLASAAAGTIGAIVPPGTAPGAGYRMRVIGSSPVTVGTVNTVDITVIGAPYAGADVAVSLCKNSGTYPLFDLLGGDPSACGTWTRPNGTVFSGELNTASDPAGAYTYTTDCPGGCPQDEATVLVSLPNPANAGNNVEVDLCSSAPPATLMAYVSGGDLNGLFWYDGHTTPMPDFTVPGDYEVHYVVYGTEPCVDDSVVMLFHVHAAPDAGNNVSATLCDDLPPVLLFDLLTGTPDEGGTWTDPQGEPSSGVLDPATGLPGLYTYAVPGVVPCPDDQAFVAVVIEPCMGIEDGQEGTLSMTWLGQEQGTHLLDMGGRAVRAMQLHDATGRAHAVGWTGQGRVQVDLSGQAPGLYFLRVRTDAGDAVVRLVHRSY